jgi:undecaprenyl-diphosphatase
VVPVAILAAVLAGVAVIGVKHSVQRPRPKHPEEGTSTQPEQRVIQDYSFPSGDTATVFAATLAVLPFVGWRWGLIPLIVGAGVAVFRVFLLRHYASDVLAGVVVGLVSGWLVLWLARRRLGRAPPGRDT